MATPTDRTYAVRTCERACCKFKPHPLQAQNEPMHDIVKSLRQHLALWQRAALRHRSLCRWRSGLLLNTARANTPMSPSMRRRDLALSAASAWLLSSLPARAAASSLRA